MAKLWGTTKMSVLIPHLGWLMALTAVAAAGCGSSAAPPSAAAEGSAAINPFPPVKVDPRTDRLGDSYFYGRVVINETLPPNGSVSVCMVPKDALQESSGQAMVQPDAVGGRVTPVDAQGKFVFRSVPPGSYVVFLRPNAELRNLYAFGRYQAPAATPFKIDIAKGGKMLNLIVKLKPREG